MLKDNRPSTDGLNQLYHDLIDLHVEILFKERRPYFNKDEALFLYRNDPVFNAEVRNYVVRAMYLVERNCYGVDNRPTLRR